MPVTGSVKHHSVVVPLLLSTGYHIATDVPRLQPFVKFRSSLPTSALRRLLGEGVVLAAAGSADLAGLADVE